jgi:hypothetical protein
VTTAQEDTVIDGSTDVRRRKIVATVDSSYEPTLSTVTSLSTATQSTVSLTDYTSNDSTITASISHSSLHLLDIYTDDDTCIHSETASLGASLGTQEDSYCATST